MRQINKLIIHCSDTPVSLDIGANEIRLWHTRDNGWSDIGYHYVIRRNGEIELGRAEETVGAHVLGHNYDSLGICLIGGRPEGDFTPEQWTSLESLIKELRCKYPDAAIHGHRDFSSKTCPTFDAQAWAISVGLNPDG